MARRTVYGHEWSSNGWPMVDEGSCTWVTVPGTNPPVSIEIQNGQPLQILRAFVADLNAYVEPVRDADTACWTPGNDVDTSNHLSGTAVDVDWDLHPFRIADAGWSPEKIAEIRRILDFYEGTIFWGDDWDDPKDAMHFQLASLANGGDINTYGNPHTQDFIDRKIRADGFSTYRRGAAPAVDAAQILSDAMLGGVSLDRYRQLLPAVSQCLTDCGCTTVDRISMWMGQVGEESGGLKWMEEIADGSEYEGRGDLGNVQPGDGTRYKGRGPIQVTGRSNYTHLSQWAFSKGLVPSPTFFVDDPAQLASDRYGFIGVTWYWTTQRPLNALADARDIVGATRAVNGGTNGLDDRTNRWNHALSMGDKLQILISGEDELSAQAEQFIEEIHGALFNDIPSQSIYATPGEGPKWKLHELIKNDDAMEHQRDVEDQAKAGDLAELGRVVTAAAGHGINREPWAVARAQRVLTEIEATNPEILKAFIAQNGATK